MKLLISILTIVLSIQFLYSQKLTTDFEGTIDYSDHFITAIFGIDTCGELEGQETWTIKNDIISIKTFDPFDSTINNFIDFSFFKQNNSVFITYIDPRDNRQDTVEQFKISQDTIDSYENYRLDPTERCLGTFSSTAYIGDTTLTINGHVYNCYRFDKFHYWRRSNPGPSHLRQIIYLDKLSLLTLQEDTYVLFKRHFCIPINEWILTRQLKIEEINGG